MNNRVVFIIFSNGIELVAELLTETEHTVILRNPLNFIDMTPFSTLTTENNFTFYKNSLVIYYSIRESLVKLYYKKLEYNEKYSADDTIDTVIDKLLDDFENNYTKSGDENNEKKAEKSLEEISSVLQNFNVPISKKLN